MAEKGADGGEAGREGRSSLRSKDAVSASNTRNPARIFRFVCSTMTNYHAARNVYSLYCLYSIARSRSSSQTVSYVDSDSYVVVKKEQAVEGVAFEQGPMGDSSGTRGEVAGESSTGGVCVRVCPCVCDDPIHCVCLKCSVLSLPIYTIRFSEADGCTTFSYSCMLQCVQMFRAYRERIGWMMSVCVCV